MLFTLNCFKSLKDTYMGYKKSNTYRYIFGNILFDFPVYDTKQSQFLIYIFYPTNQGNVIFQE